MPNENVYFAEKELCTGMLNDRIIDDVVVGQGQLYRGRRKMPQARPSVPTSEAFVMRKGVMARVMVPTAVPRADPDEPLVAGGHELLGGLTPAERKSLLSADQGSGRAGSSAAHAAIPPPRLERPAADSAGRAPAPPWKRGRRHATTRWLESNEAGDDGKPRSEKRRKKGVQQSLLSFDAGDDALSDPDQSHATAT